MTVLLQQRAGEILRATPAPDCVVLDYEGRFLRRKRLVSRGGVSFLVDLPETVSLDPGDAFRLEDGRLIGVEAAMEPCLRVEGALPRLAWHIGNRHTPCQITTDHLLIRADHVLEGMLRGLGARVSATMARFDPEGGAYGHGRTMGHDHGPGGHGH
ncbi:MAG: urease accessory protein UreE [Paracoccus sp. (in: a-proteobacteria)]|uniref:urease accessory protein UreE n=1 Tax=Paracoccus sp. TaxID=267 RepID=UPI0039E6D3C6